MAATLYETLGIDPSANDQQIKKAYRSKARSTHPDHGGSAAAFSAVQLAYETLRDADKRADYDRTLLDPEVVDVPVDEDIDWAWGPSEDMAVPSYDGEDPLPTGDTRLARFPVLPASLAVPIVVVTFGVWSRVPSMYDLAPNVRTAAANAAIVFFPLALLRSFAPRWRTWALALNVTFLLALGGAAFKWHHLSVGLALVAVMFVSAELVRLTVEKVRVWHDDRHYPDRWVSLRNAATLRGHRRLWVSSVGVGRNGRQVAVLWDPLQQAWEQNIWLPAPLPAQMWVVLDPAGRMVVACPDKAREVWERTRA